MGQDKGAIDLGKSRTIAGMLVSLAYLVWVGTIVVPKFDQLYGLDLNALGDFFAGIFGPLAFLWLVLGYFQQGLELRQNNEALKLQASELKNSVEQQKELVSVARDQVNADLEGVRHAREQAEAALNPVIIANGGGGSHSGNNHSLNLSLRNVGAPVSNVRCSFSGVFNKYEASVVILDKGDNLTFSIGFVGGQNEFDGVEDVLSISYVKSNNTPGDGNFFVKVVWSGQYPTLKITRPN